MANNLRGEVKKYLEGKLHDVEKKILVALNYTGVEAVAHARKNVVQNGDRHSPPTKPTYTVRTGNLVSSIGYSVVKDGSVMNTSDFSSVSGPEGNGSEGSQAGKTFATEKAGEKHSGVSLIVVAGMNYAGYVEAKGYDVLNSAQLLAEKQAKLRIENVLKNI